VAFSFLDLATLFHSNLHNPAPAREIEAVSIDTRSIGPNSLFVALQGENTDGHLFLEDAFRQEAVGAVVSSGWLKKHPDTSFPNLIPVKDPEKALAQMARAYRKSLKAKMIGITGSMGKTSTKEMLAFLLGRHAKVAFNEGNLNNHLGLPLTLLHMEENTQYGVVELGANHVGEIDYLSSILKPNAAMITRIGSAHLEGFGSLEGIYSAKTEMVSHLEPNAVLLMPDDDKKLFELVRHRSPLRVGQSADADYRVEILKRTSRGREFSIQTPAGKCFGFKLSHAADYFAQNAAMALAMADAQGFQLEQFPEDWNELALPAGRFELVELTEDLLVVFDGYNANPESFRESLKAFCELECRGRRFLVMADMLELGKDARRHHRELGEAIAEFPIDEVYAYGSLAEETVLGLKAKQKRIQTVYGQTPYEILTELMAKISKGDTILLKASRGMKIERILDGLKKQYVTIR